LKEKKKKKKKQKKKKKESVVQHTTELSRIPKNKFYFQIFFSCSLKKNNVSRLQENPIFVKKKKTWILYRRPCTDRQADRQTHKHTSAHKKKTPFRTRVVIKRVNPSKVGGRIFCAITILPLCSM